MITYIVIYFGMGIAISIIAETKEIRRLKKRNYPLPKEPFLFRVTTLLVLAILWPFFMLLVLAEKFSTKGIFKK